VSGGERAKILDFGIAKLHAASQVVTAPASLIGTPRYMSPEQCRGDADIDGRTDVYALGILLYEMVAGEAPFHGDRLEGVLAQHLFKTPEPLAARAPQAPRGLAELVHRMLVKERALRPTMAQVEAALGVLLARKDAPPALPEATPPAGNSTIGPTSYRQKTLRRAATWQQGLAVLLAAAAIATGVGTLFVRLLPHARPQGDISQPAATPLTPALAIATPAPPPLPPAPVRAPTPQPSPPAPSPAAPAKEAAGPAPMKPAEAAADKPAPRPPRRKPRASGPRTSGKESSVPNVDIYGIQ
jgi:serine/threonine-protein kinase